MGHWSHRAILREVSLRPTQEPEEVAVAEEWACQTEEQQVEDTEEAEHL